MSYEEGRNDALDLILMEYKALSRYQQWVFMKVSENEDGSIQITRPAGSKKQLCWDDPTTDDFENDKISSQFEHSSVLVKTCRKSPSQQHFFFEPLDTEIKNGKNCTIAYASNFVERKSKKSKKNKNQ